MPEPTTQARLEEQFVTETIPIGLPWRLLVFSLVLFGLSVSVYFGLRFGYANYLTTEAGNLDKKTEELSRQVKQEDQQQFINFYSQLINLKKALDRHGFTSNIFNFLERNTLGTVYYTQANFSVDGLRLDLSGETNSSETLVQQLFVFDKSPELEEVILEEMRFDPRGSVGFSAKLAFKQEFFSLPKQ